MTDKEPVMIKGIDVSKCRYFCIYDETCRDENIGHIVRPACKNVPDCYFKQLTLKTQECGELKAYAQRQENQREEYYKEYQKLKQDLFLAQNQITLKNEYIQKVKQECEELKSQVDEDYNYYTTELKTLRDIISNKEKRNAALYLTSGRYRKALEEIKKVCIEDTREFADGTEVRYDSLDDILDIISRAKGEEDE